MAYSSIDAQELNDRAARSNKLVNADAQGRPAATRRPPLGRGLHARYVA